MPLVRAGAAHFLKKLSADWVGEVKVSHAADASCPGEERQASAIRSTGPIFALEVRERASTALGAITASDPA